jgi:hypothetical protein
MDYFERSPGTPGTLAGWVVTLDAGSACFCCGAPLRRQWVSTASARDGTNLLQCDACGARVSTEDPDGVRIAPAEISWSGPRCLAA